MKRVDLKFVCNGVLTGLSWCLNFIRIGAYTWYKAIYVLGVGYLRGPFRKQSNSSKIQQRVTRLAREEIVHLYRYTHLKLPVFNHETIS